MMPGKESERIVTYKVAWVRQHCLVVASSGRKAGVGSRRTSQKKPVIDRLFYVGKGAYLSLNASYFAFNTGFMRYCRMVFLPVLICTVETIPGMIGSFLCVPVKVPLLVRT